jgi:hypothetical protein
MVRVKLKDAVFGRGEIYRIVVLLDAVDPRAGDEMIRIGVFFLKAGSQQDGNKRGNKGIDEYGFHKDFHLLKINNRKPADEIILKKPLILFRGLMIVISTK